MSSDDYTQWSAIAPFFGSKLKASLSGWVPNTEVDRIASYAKYDQMYWNDPKQFVLRVLDGEEPLYIPNARTVVDTTAHYLLKGLSINCEGSEEEQLFLKNFLKREAFYSRWNVAKTSGVARGDFVFHLTADPTKADGTRISLNSVDPSMVFPVWDDDDPDKMVGVHIAQQYYLPNDPNKTRVRVLTYMKELPANGDASKAKISREESIYELIPSWWSTGEEKPKLVKKLIPKGYLDPRITQLPVYWFKNKYWEGELFGSSELRGLETIQQAISQGSTDVSAALALEGLGVYATDGGRPVDGSGNETDWEVAPGKVMEVPQGSYFRRVEGVGSITPARDQIDYLEGKLHEATGLTDVALGTVDAQVAQSGIALAIKFIPTLAKLETRDQEGIDKLTQLFYDWKTWVAIFERKTLSGDIVPSIGDKLPTDRTARVNELNNMYDRHVISGQYYRDEMTKLGYSFPEWKVMEEQIKLDLQVTRLASEAANVNANNTNADLQNGNGGPSQQGNSSQDSQGNTSGATLPNQNKSNNKGKVNESNGTEANAKQQKRDASAKK
jgi:hypothetical protein